jgi:hypothetical protein
MDGKFRVKAASGGRCGRAFSAPEPASNQSPIRGGTCAQNFFPCRSAAITDNEAGKKPRFSGKIRTSCRAAATRDGLRR